MTETLKHVDELEPQEPLEEGPAAGEAFGAAAPDAQPSTEPDLSAANAAVIRQMVLAAKDAGMDLTGPGGLLKQLTKVVIETALDEEMSEHLGYDKHDPAGRGSGNSRNGMRSKTVVTDNAGPVDIDVPRDRNGSFEPQLVKKRQRRLGDLDAMVLSLYAKGLTMGEISAHLGEVYGASVSKDTVSRITDRVVEEMQAWWARPLEKVYAAIFIDAIVVKVRDGQVRNRGLLQLEVASVVSGGGSRLCGSDRLELDGGEASEAGLPTASVVGLLDPRHDRDPKVLTGAPVLPIQDVLLQQCEEGFHRGVVAGRTDSSHGPDQAMPVERVDEFA